MTIKYSHAVNNARLAAIESTIAPTNTNAVLRIYGGSLPANTTDAAGSTHLVSIPLNDPWLAAPVNGVMAKSGTWSAAATLAGTATFFRILDASATNVGIQGTCGTSGADMILDNVSIANTQVVTVNSFQITAGNLGP